MLDNNFTVKYINARNCFLVISEANQRKLSYQKVVKIKFLSKELYCSCISSSIIVDDNVVGIPSLYAKDLGIRENESVYMVDISRVPSLTKIIVTPISSDDYEILDLSSEVVQSTLLDQIRVVNVNQKLTIWISKWLNTTVKIEDADPLRFGYLSNLTEVHVMQFPAINPTTEGNEIVENKEPKKPNFTGCQEMEILRQYIRPISTNVFRVQSLEAPETLTKDDLIVSHPFNVFIYENSVPAFIKIDNVKDVALCRLAVIEPPEFRNAEGKSKEKCDIIVRVTIIEKYYNLFSDEMKLCFKENMFHQKYPTVYIPEKSMQYFDLVIGSKVSLCQNFEFPSDVRSVEIFSSDIKCKTAVEKFKNFLSDRVKSSKCLLNADVCFQVDNLPCLIKFNPRSKFCIFDEIALRNCKIYENSEVKGVFPPTIANSLFIDTDKICLEMNELKKIIREAEILFKMKNQNENILITGRSGSGKTSLAKVISENVSKNAPYFYKIYTNCKRLKGKTVETLHKIFTQDFRNLTYYQPSILILDDLDILCKRTESDSDAKTQETSYSARVSEMLSDLIKYYQKSNRISIIATCQSYFEMNDIIVSPRGQHIFKNLFEIPELSKHHRFLILTKLFNERKVLIDPLNVEKMAVKTEGYVVQDLIDLVDRCIFEYHKRIEKKLPVAPHLEDMDVDNSLSSITPLSLQSISFHSSANSDSNISLSDIGGLSEAKARLMENVSWPGLYPELFGDSDGVAECPVKFARGTLLFGPPGVGKTALVGAVARECQVRLIVINGPELLSKYVGESERAVRSVFERAHQARPCVLFFDEFESAACRRGKDSTGVTDRVVNQLLVQLDGVEGNGGGVYVVAATSRPDLVDPALLRPGRLGVRVRCEVPDQSARLYILRALSKRLHLAPDVDMMNVAAMTPGYTGADLQAVLYTAQLLAVEEAITINEGKSVELVIITQAHMKQALTTTQPSLSNREAQKYEKIYAKFQLNKDLTEATTNIKKQKTILA